MSRESDEADTWARVEELFHEARERDPGEREAWLTEACGGDDALHRRVTALLDAESGADHFFEASPELETHPLLHGAREMTGESIGGFRLVRLIARGGMGSVYEAEQDEPRRRVALKILHRAYDEEWRRRFRLEARILAHLRHPGIAQIHDAGIEAGIPYFAMEFIEGESVTRHVRTAGLGTRGRLELFACICDAVHHAHLKGVIHRDIKPANILVDPDGHPKVVDFGLARANTDEVESSVFETNEGVIYGTLPYMSPEQSGVGDDLVDLRSDVYALGVVLWEMLAERPAFPMADSPLTERLEMIRVRMPPKLGTLSRELAGDVEIIAAKAMDKSADRRYSSASELAADVRRYLADEPILARPPSAAYQLAKFARRNRTLVITGAAAVVVLVAFSITVTSLFVNARDAADAEREAKANERKERLRAESALEEAALFNEALQRVFASSAGDGGVLHDARVVDVLHRWREGLETTFADRPAAGVPAMRMMGTMYIAVGDYEAAHDVLRTTAAVARRAYGAESQETLSTLTELAIVQEVLGLLGEAEENARHVHAVRERLEPDGHRDGYRNVAVLAKILIDAHRLVEAEAVIRGVRGRIGPGGPQTIDLSLAHICEVTGRLDEASRILAELERSLRDTFGDQPSLFIGLRCQQSSVALARGECDRAREIAAETLADSIDFRGPDHRQTLELEQLVLSAALEGGDVTGAIARGTDLVSRCEELFGKKHEQTIRARITLAVAHFRRGDYATADELLETAEDDADGVLPPLSTLRLRCTEYRIRVHLTRNRNELAGEVGEEIIEALDASTEPVTTQSISIRRAQATALERRDRHDEAVALLRRAQELMDSRPGFDDSERLRVLNDLAAIHFLAGDLDASEPVIRSVFEIRRDRLGEDNPATVKAMNNLAMVLLRLERLDEAEPLLRRSVELASPPHADESLGLGAYVFGHAECLLAMDRLEEAERTFRRALDLFERFEREDHLYRRAAWKVLADVCDRLGRAAEAARWRKLLGTD